MTLDTKLKESEAQLRAMAENPENLLEAMNVVMSSFSPTGGLLLRNPELFATSCAMCASATGVYALNWKLESKNNNGETE